MTAILVLQHLLFANSEIAGRMDCESESIPITSLKLANFLNTDNLTSELSSLKSWRNTCIIDSVVSDFPIIGQTDRRFSAKAILTYTKLSSDSFLKVGIIFN